MRIKKVRFIKNYKKGGFNLKGNFDVELTIDVVHDKGKFESFLLFSGDGDFAALIKYLKIYRKRCLVFSTKNHVSIELLKQAKYINLKKLKKFISK